MKDIRTLYEVIPVKEVVSEKVLNKKNRYKQWEPGYDSEHDIVIISRDGTLGSIVEVHGLQIGLPKPPENVFKRSDKAVDQYWEKTPLPKELTRIKSVFDWQRYPDEFKNKWVDLIEQEFNYRENGYWFKNNGTDTYITGSHYFFVQYAKIDVGAPDYRESNRIFYYFWEACKLDTRCFGLCYLKNRRSGFSFMAASDTVNMATISSDARFGILSKTGADAKKLFTDKVVPISVHLPFFFKPIQDGSDRPKTELSYKIPAAKLTRKSIQSIQEDEFAGVQGLDTTIDHKNTGDNSYDGEKLKLLVHDESGKWEKPNNILNNWTVTQTCLLLGRKIVGKAMMGSTSNKLDNGGQEFKDLYYDSDLTRIKRNKNGRTPSGLYAFFINALWNMEGFFDRYGAPVFEITDGDVDGIDGEAIDQGVVDFWENTVDGLKHNPDAQNEYYRQFPLTEKHAFRDDVSDSLFNLTKIYEQIDWNEELNQKGYVTTGSFQWANGVPDTKVEWHPSRTGRFKLTWVPPMEYRNKVIERDGVKHPGNMELGAFGCDSYDISGTVGGGGSNGALHGLTAWSMYPNVPNNMFFLEYVARPQTAEIFFEDVLMACVFYGMPLLCENNKPRLLYHFKRRGYRGFSMNRPDKTWQNLSKAEQEIGGIPNSSEDIKQAHASAIEAYIENHVGLDHETDEMGKMYFNRTLEDWVRFDITKRTAYDASISSGLAIMACQRKLYRPTNPRPFKKIDLGIQRYRNSGMHSRKIKV